MYHNFYKWANPAKETEEGASELERKPGDRRNMEDKQKHIPRNKKWSKMLINVAKK